MNFTVTLFLSLLLTVLCQTSQNNQKEIIIDKIINLSRESNLSILSVDTIFFISHRKNGENALLVLVSDKNDKNSKDKDFYIITKQKTLIITDLIEDIHNVYKFMYYVTDKIDVDLTDVTVFGLESVVQDETYSYLIDEVVNIT
jgi:hypothetical protein